jgi:hypothetical protein
MALVDESLMARNAEILLAGSAGPDSISSDATLGLSEAALFHQKAPPSGCSFLAAPLR